MFENVNKSAEKYPSDKWGNGAFYMMFSLLEFVSKFDQYRYVRGFSLLESFND